MEIIITVYFDLYSKNLYFMIYFDCLNKIINFNNYSKNYSNYYDRTCIIV